jgi:hypothetical protein
MGVVVQVTDRDLLPGIRWTWEPETDILAGAFRPTLPGPQATLELSGHEGSVVVLDLAGGRLAGLDVVVWPEVVTVPGLVSPLPSRQGLLELVADGGPGTQELEVTLVVRANPGEDVIHLRVGAPRQATVVQVADHLAVEVDPAGGLAGFWLTAVPPLTGPEETA